MGCDGGTIPKRKEIVKSKQKDKNRDKNVDLSAKWQFCSLSGLPLKRPIVSCQLGRIYNKEAIIEHLLELKTSSSTQTNSQASHIKTLRDVRELKLKEKKDYDRAHQAASGSEQFKAQYVCPITGLDMNGKYKFLYLLTCGCVVSERALKQVPNEKQCILCSRPYDPELDLIILNGDEDEVKDLQEKLASRKQQQRSAKKMHEQSTSATHPSNHSSTVEKNSHKSDTNHPQRSSKRHKAEQVAVTG